MGANIILRLTLCGDAHEFGKGYVCLRRLQIRCQVSQESLEIAEYIDCICWGNGKLVLSDEYSIIEKSFSTECINLFYICF